ncbi:MAG: hypothetical protein Q4C34_07820 [Bacteroidales bacterium]|nr:hypothetical protein [Bacteroidales bacterium]
MELEDLKSTWQSVKPRLDEMTGSIEADPAIYRRPDIKTRLLRRVAGSELFSAICLVLMATSRLWSPTAFPVVWLIVFCSIILTGIICGIYLYLLIKRIDLSLDTNNEIFSSVVKIKRYYRNVELAICIVTMPVLIWLSLTPPFIYTPSMYIAWILVIVTYILEYFWYKSNIRQLNRLTDLDKE